MAVVSVNELLEAGVHFGHRTSRWNPKMKPFLLGKRNTIHIIDLKQTVRGLARATHFLRAVTAEGYDVLFVGTKRSAKNVIREEAVRCEMPFVTERWLGGTLTNFETIRGRLQRLEELEGVELSGDFDRLSKKEQSRHNREKRKLLKNLAGIRAMSNLPGALVIVDPRREHIAVREANRANIPIIAVVDTDCDPDPIDIPIPGNDDAMRSVSVLVKRLAESCITGKKAAKSRAAELRRGMDESTQAAIAEATGEAGRRGPSKTVVVRRASAAPAAAPEAAEAAPAPETPAEPAAPEAPADTPEAPAAPESAASTESQDSTEDKPAE